jgi:hypothetical protein
MDVSLPIINLAQAKFECTYGRGCEGTCCREGHPIVYPEEIERLDANLHRFLPALRPEARKVIQTKGYLTEQRRLEQRMVRSAAGWCVFFNHGGCVLHRAGEAEGDRFKYKPAACSLFPLQQDESDRWYVRQKGFNSEKWKLFCLDPTVSAVPAAESLQVEIALAKRFDDEAKKPETNPGVHVD